MLNFRKHYHLYLSNTKDNSYGAGPFDLLMPESPSFSGTLRQCMAEIREFARISGGCAIARRIVDPATGKRVDIDEVATELMLRDIK